MRYTFYSLILFLLLPFASMQAQEYDTTVVAPPVADTTVYEDEEYETAPDEEANTTYDTSLAYYRWYYPTDSIHYLRKHKEFNYANNLDSLLKIRQDELNKQQKQASKATTTSVDIGALLKAMLWIILIAVLLFVLYRVFLSDRGLFTSPTKNKIIKVEEELLTDDSYLEQQLKQAERDKNFRLAIRYLYLQTLNRLSERNWLNLSPDKTNYQYVRELAKPQLRNSFSRITLHYEYAWYGDFTIDETVYEQVKSDYDQFNQTAKQS